MRGRKLCIPDSVFVEMFKTKGIKQISDELGIPMTTVTSRLQAIGVYQNNKANHITLTPENIKFINEHTACEIAAKFNVSVSYVRNLASRKNLSYIRTTNNRLMSVTKIEDKKIFRDTLIKMHENMTYKEIGKVFNITPARVSQIINCFIESYPASQEESSEYEITVWPERMEWTEFECTLYCWSVNGKDSKVLEIGRDTQAFEFLMNEFVHKKDTVIVTMKKGTYSDIGIKMRYK